MAFDAKLNQEIGLRVRHMREQQALSRERLAEQAEISTQFLADIETGRKGMTVQTLRRLATALHCSSDDLVFGPSENCASVNPALVYKMLSLSPEQAGLAGDILNLVIKALPPDAKTQ